MQVKAILAVVLSALSAACVPGLKVDPNNAQAVASSVEKSYDEFRKMTTFIAPDVNPDVLDEVFMRAWKDEATSAMQYQIYVLEYYGGEWKFYTDAYDSGGNVLPLKQIQRKVNSCSSNHCSYIEHVGIIVDRAYLEKHVSAGLRFKVSGKGGEGIFSIPGPYIGAFLDVAK